MRLIAKKPCSFGGKKYLTGQEIPAGEVLDPEGQEKMGVLSIIKDGKQLTFGDLEAQTGEVKFHVPVSNGSESSVIDLTEAELVEAVGIMQKNQNEAVKAVRNVESESVLILVNALDSRKNVKTETADRAGALADREAKAGKAGES